ncbi:MAG TPA: hypothetical protein VF927_11815 [Solirubrobacteraceae bacterium]
MTATGSPRARVSIQTLPIWRLRAAREAPRYVLGALAAFGLFASARFAIAPPRPVAPPAVRATATPDLGAEGYAVEFARRYLTWTAAEPLASVRSLESFAGPQMESAAGLQLPATGEEQVRWAEVVQSREPVAGVHVYTVSAETSTEGLRYLTVSVERTSSGSLALAGYPAFVGAPASSPAVSPPPLRPVEDGALEAVVRRALSNYLSDSPAELAADLTEGARVVPPAPGLRLLSIERQQWAPGGGAVLAVLQAVDRSGARYTLAYEVDAALTQGRWEISAIQTEPDA